MRAAVVALLSVAAGPGWAVDAPRDFVAAVEARLRAARALPAPDTREPACRALLAEAFDAETLARTAAGAHWPGFDAALREAMTEAVARRLGRECPALLSRPDAGAMEVARERADAAGARIVTRLPRPDGTATVLSWTIVPGGAQGWRLADLAADGIGIAATLRSEFDALVALHEGDLRAAIGALATGGRP